MRKPRIKPLSNAAADAALRAGARVETAHRGASLESRDMAAWVPPLGSPDADLLPEMGSLVSRTRDLIRNNGVAAGGVRTVQDNVLGTGMRLIPRPNWRKLGMTLEQAQEWAQDVREQWEAYYWTTACHAGDSMTGDQITRQTFGSVIGGNGEALALPLWIPDRRDGWATKIQTVESDRLDNPGFTIADPSVRGGIKFGKYGEPLGYYIRKRHPGDMFMPGRFLGFGGPEDFEFVPRRTPSGRLRVLHVFDAERPGQSRGKSAFASVLSNFKQIDRYVEAEIMAAVSNAMIAGTIETPLDHESILELFRGNRDEYMESRAKHRTRIESGTFVPLFPGDKLEPFLPSRPATAFGAFVQNVFQIIGVGLDLPDILLRKDFSKVNYSSARAALIEAWRSFSRWRDWLGTMFLDPWYALWMEEAANTGRIALPVDFYENRGAYTKCLWLGPARGQIDPTKETDAVEKRLALNISTLEAECAELGRDWREVAEQRAIERAYMRELETEYALDPVTPPAPSSNAPYPSDAVPPADAPSDNAPADDGANQAAA
jgi:lambda family phage portal protein